MRTELAELISAFAPGDGLHALPVPGAHGAKATQPNHSGKQHWRASMSIIAQGGKEIVLGSETYRYREGHYIATPIDLPVISRVCSASPEEPFLCLRILFDPLTLSEVAAQLECVPKERETGRAVFLGKASDAMLEAAVRLGRLGLTPEDAPVLGPLVTRELIYHLLKSADGPALRQFVRAGSSRHKIAQAVYSLRAGLGDPLDVGALAKAANMSRSAFFKHFKDATALSPIQYQKRLRLLEARRLMTEAGETAEGAAFQVGYSSASQFSREYSRMFGNAPLRDAAKIKQTGVSLRQM